MDDAQAQEGKSCSKTDIILEPETEQSQKNHGEAENGKFYPEDDSGMTALPTEDKSCDGKLILHI
jgi:hypothetical protein